MAAAHRGLLDIGIDEGTAILVCGNELTVVGPSVVAISDGVLRDGKSYYLLRQGARFDRATWVALNSGT